MGQLLELWMADLAARGNCLLISAARRLALRAPPTAHEHAKHDHTERSRHERSGGCRPLRERLANLVIEGLVIDISVRSATAAALWATGRAPS